MPRPMGIAALFATAAILSACQTTGGTVNYVDVETAYEPDNVGWAVHEGKLAAVVHGSPFGPEDPVVAEKIAEGLDLPGWFPPARLTTRPTGAQGSKAAFRLVMVFNPVPPYIGGKGACGDLASMPTGHAGPTMRVAMAFCNDAKPEAELLLEAPRGAGPGDPAFRARLNHALSVMLPHENPSRRDSNGPFRRRG